MKKYLLLKTKVFDDGDCYSDASVETSVVGDYDSVEKCKEVIKNQLEEFAKEQAGEQNISNYLKDSVYYNIEEPQIGEAEFIAAHYFNSGFETFDSWNDNWSIFHKYYIVRIT